jgi:hypothetical protein
MKKPFYKNKVLLVVLFVFAFSLLKNCSFHPLPKEKIGAFKIEKEENFENGEYHLILKNPVHCPVRFFLSSEEESVNQILENISPILLKGKADTLIKVKDQGDLTDKVLLKVKWGNPKLPILTNTLKSLPFEDGKSYELLQGNNAYPTHNTVTSRYAFDFTMNVESTVCSAQDGFVVGVIDGYKGWGRSAKWKPFGNFIMVYDTSTHLFTQYGHIKQNGSLVNLGDYVKIGQPIGYTGKSGQMTEPHLHFNVLQGNDGKSSLKSYRLDSIGNYAVKKLKRYQWMKN